MWEDYAEELDYSINSGAEEPFAVLLKFCRTTVFRGMIKYTQIMHAVRMQNITQDLYIINY